MQIHAAWGLVKPRGSSRYLNLTCIEEISTDRVADEELRLLLLSDEFATEMQPGDLATSTPTLPLAINKHITFANCTITGNITNNIHQTERKREESDSEE